VIDERAGHLGDVEGGRGENRQAGADGQFFEHKSHKREIESDLTTHREKILRQKNSD